MLFLACVGKQSEGDWFKLCDDIEAFEDSFINAVKLDLFDVIFEFEVEGVEEIESKNCKSSSNALLQFFWLGCSFCIDIDKGTDSNGGADLIESEGKVEIVGEIEMSL